MKTRHRTALMSSLVLGIMLPATSAAFEIFSEDFQSGVLNSQLQIIADPGFSIAFTGGQAQVSQHAGSVNGLVLLTSLFQGTGDFSTTV